jgi:hypothetical protein
VGADGDEGSHPAFEEAPLVYNGIENEYLIAWNTSSSSTEHENEVYGQRVAASGALLGSDFRISNVGQDGDPMRGSSAPELAFNSNDNEYLAIWTGDGLAVDQELEIFGQRINANGLEIGTDFRISNVGEDGDTSRASGFHGWVSFATRSNEYLVTWDGSGLPTEREVEVFGQRLSSEGAEIGTDFRISNIGEDGDPYRRARYPVSAYSPRSDEFLVTFEANGLPADGEVEVFGRLVKGDSPMPGPGPLPDPPGGPTPPVESRPEDPGVQAPSRACEKALDRRRNARMRVRSLRRKEAPNSRLVQAREPLREARKRVESACLE